MKLQFFFNFCSFLPFFSHIKQKSFILMQEGTNYFLTKNLHPLKLLVLLLREIQNFETRNFILICCIYLTVLFNVIGFKKRK